MSAGLPGAGIAGVFYLASALLMPAIELERTRRGRSSMAAWRLVVRQFLVSCAILVGIWTTGWLLGLAAFSPARTAAASGGGITTTPQVVGKSAMFVSIFTLIVLVAGVEIASFWRARRASAASEER
jgi:hypothetical protein